MKNVKFKFNKQKMVGRVLTLGLVLLAVSPMFANSAGVSGFSDATTKIKSFWKVLTPLIQVIGGIVGIVGGLRIYNKWTNGDQDINKELVAWGGACVFLIVAPTFISSFFNMA